MKIPDLVQKELEKCPYPYEIQSGGMHYKIFVAGELCGIFPRNGKFPARRAELNIRSQIRRRVKQLNDEFGEKECNS